MFSNTAAVADPTVDRAVCALEVAARDLAALDFGTLSNVDRLAVLQRVEAISRSFPAVGHRLINHMLAEWQVGELGDRNLTQVLADSLRLSPGEARSRISVADDLGPRPVLSGGIAEPTYASTAEAQAEGAIGSQHVAIIREFFKHLSPTVDFDTRQQAETMLAEQARILRPDQLRKAADRLRGYLDPDGSLDEQQRAKKRSFQLGPQGPDKLSKGTFVADPELRAYLETVFAKYAKPGVCNPGDESPAVDDEPSAEAVQRDSRSVGQRQHDALKAALRAVLASGELGTHRGLPTSVVVTTSLKELEDGTGTALTAGGTLLPVRDVIRMGRHAHHYLVLFDDAGRPIYLGRSKRIATADQRIVLHAKDRGCTFPGCYRPGSMCECHHCREWATQHGLTNVDELTFACQLHHPLVGTRDTDWQTIIAGPSHEHPGRTLWIPPKHVDPEQRPRINHFHHPGEYLMGDASCDDEGEPRQRAAG